MLTFEENESIRRIIDSIGAQDDDYCAHKWNVWRWFVAYENDEVAASKALKRHLNLRRILDLDSYPHKTILDEEQLFGYFPTDIIGQNHPNDNQIFMFEKTGKIDISGLVDNVLMHKFMQIKLKMMESVHQRVVAAERQTSTQSGGVFVMDLEGLSFSTKLISVLTGPYRIMWGTLFDHYPQLLQKIIIVNAPSFVNVLHHACSPFLPEDYKRKIVISSKSAINALPEYIHQSMLPIELGGELDRGVSTPITPYPEGEQPSIEMVDVNIPAGKYTVQKFQWKGGEEINFYLKNDSSFHYFMFHSIEDTNDINEWKEITIGCERPALSQIDYWQYTVPFDGFYYIRYGNQNSWYFSTTVKTKHFIIKDLEKQEIVPIDTFII